VRRIRATFSSSHPLREDTARSVVEEFRHSSRYQKEKRKKRIATDRGGGKILFFSEVWRKRPVTSRDVCTGACSLDGERRSKGKRTPYFSGKSSSSKGGERFKLPVKGRSLGRKNFRVFPRTGKNHAGGETRRL